jgi:hypothetical protein
MNEAPANKNARGYYEVQGEKRLEIDLRDNDPNKFAVVKKDIDTGIPTKYGKLTIRWVNAFGIRHKKDDGSLGDFADISYTIIMDALEANQLLFAYYGGQIHQLQFESVGKLLRASLAVGDPPIGLAP